MHGLFTHIFRSPSKHDFQLNLLRPEASAAVAKFNGDNNCCPCTRTVDDVFNNLEPNDFLPILPAIFRYLCRAKVFQLHPELIPGGEYGVAIDAHVTHEHSLSIIQLDEHAEKKTSKRFAKVTSKHTHWEWIVHRYLTPTNVSATAAQSRTRWKQEDLFNDLQHRGFAICHDFNRAPSAQSVRNYLILIAYAICTILTYSRLGKLILSKGTMTIIHMMTEMLEDLTRIPEAILFKCRDPGQLRWGTDPPEIVVRAINY
jgi:hypothetical protein